MFAKDILTCGRVLGRYQNGSFAGKEGVLVVVSVLLPSVEKITHCLFILIKTCNQELFLHYRLHTQHLNLVGLKCAIFPSQM